MLKFKDTGTHNINKLEIQFETMKIEMAAMVKYTFDEKTLELEFKQLRREMIQLKLENKLMADKISDLEKTKEDNEIEKLKMEREQLKTQNEKKNIEKGILRRSTPGKE